MSEESRVKVSDLAERVGYNSEVLYYVRPYTHLRGDFFEGEWRYAEPAEGGDSLSWSDVHGEQWTGMFGATHTVDKDDDQYQPLLNIRGAGLGDYNGTGTVDRSNMEWLLEHYPDTFITIGHSSHDGQSLALPMAADIPEELADRLEGLWSYVEPLDSDHLSRLEETLLTECWDSWIRSDFESGLEKYIAATFEVPEDKLESEILEETLTAASFSDLRELFDRAMEDAGDIEWETSESCHIHDFDAVVSRAASILFDEEL